MASQRQLIVTADDFGIGPETLRGILDLAASGVVTSTVMLVNSPHAADGVAMWVRAGRPLELGWHPCLTIDSPLLPPTAVPSLVGPDGRFLSLGGFLQRLALGRVSRAEVYDEFRAQFRRFVELVGRPPRVVNAHHHVHVFEPVGAALRRVLAESAPGAYLRHVGEPARMLWAVSGARAKRFFLTRIGRAASRLQAAAGLPGAEALAGIAHPARVGDTAYFTRWLRASRGDSLELMCHPGHADATLAGRDVADQTHRVRELELLRSPAFLDTARAAGFTLVPAAAMSRHPTLCHAA